jgi:GT2 family glycosyltransferase
VQVSFIIPLFNCLPLTQAMLASLRATIPAGLTHEIIFVDDGSTDATREWLGTLRDESIHVLLNERNLGYAAANNRAAAVARGNLLALLNNDLVLQPGWLEPILAAHTALGANAGVIGNVQLDATTGVVDHAGLVVNVTGKPVHARALPHALARALQPVLPVPGVTGACMIIARALWQQLGGFDEQYVNGGEDFDLCLRARKLGRVNAVALRSVIRHHVSSSPGRKARDEQNSYRLALRWRHDLIPLADAGTREWCRDYLRQSLRVPESREYRLALAACAYLIRARANPPPEAITAVKNGLQREFKRWAEMFPDETRSEAAVMQTRT